jgi:FtsZ-interacting cell division protein ZipA
LIVFKGSPSYVLSIFRSLTTTSAVILLILLFSLLVAAFERRREELKRSFSKQMQEKVESKTKHHAVAEEELKKKVEALQTELSASKVSLTDKQTELVALSRTFRKKLEALDQAQKEALHTAHAQRDEMRHLGEENAELKENLARLSEKTAEDADLPRTTPAPSPALKSTAVVTPQTQVAPPQLLSRPTITARPPHPPVAAVAPQAQEQLHLQPVISAINQVDALAVVLPVNAETSEMPSGSSGLAGGTQTASTPGKTSPEKCLNFFATAKILALFDFFHL